MLDYEEVKKWFADKLSEDFKGIGRFESAFYWTVQKVFHKGVSENDIPEWDCTDFAHPAWWRGMDYATITLCSKIGDILDGKDDGQGTCSEPWGTIRRRLLQAVANQGPESEFEFIYIAKGNDIVLCRNEHPMVVAELGVVHKAVSFSAAKALAAEWNGKRRAVPKPAGAPVPPVVD